MREASGGSVPVAQLAGASSRPAYSVVSMGKNITVLTFDPGFSLRAPLLYHVPGGEYKIEKATLEEKY